MGYNQKCYGISFVLLSLLSYLLLLGILSAVYNERYSEEDKFEFIYYMSKILTLKSIIVNSHYSELLDGFSPSGEPYTLSSTYRNLLKLNKNKDECIENYKPCGILDTYGNVLCIEEYIPCPVNKMRIAHINAAEDYLNSNYKTVQLTNVSKNYQFFYSNEFYDGNAVAVIIKTKDEPKFVSLNNFILDSETYEQMFGNDKFIKDIADFLGIEEEDKNTRNENDFVDGVVKIFQEVNELADGLSEVELSLKGAKLLVKILLTDYNERVEKFEKFVKEKIEILDEKNNDIFFQHLGDNFYAKNYIGFKSVKDIDKFMRFDFNIYKKIFPTFTGSTCALVSLIIIAIFLVFIFIYFLVVIKDNRFDFEPYLIYPCAILYYVPLIGFFIYSLYAYFKVNKSKTLDDLKSIQSDEFINSFINDFINDCQKSTLVLSTIFITLASIILNVLSIIILKILKTPEKLETIIKYT